MGLTLINPPGEEPVTLGEAKAHLRVDVSDEDALITALIVAARRQAEHRTGRALVTSTWKHTQSAFPVDSLELPKPPLQSVSVLRYLDANGVQQTLAGTEYQAVTDELIGRVLPAYGKSWPACREMPGAVEVTFVAGYGNAAAVPQDIKAWINLAVGNLFSNRETMVAGQVNELPGDFFSGLLDPYLTERAA